MLVVAALFLGCQAGSQHERRGDALLARGDAREAFHAFYRAWVEEPSPRRRASMDRAGREVARSLLAEGEALEGRLRVEEALGRYALALEYDPGFHAARSAYLRVWRRLWAVEEPAGEPPREDSPRGSVEDRLARADRVFADVLRDPREWEVRATAAVAMLLSELARLEGVASDDLLSMARTDVESFAEEWALLDVALGSWIRRERAMARLPAARPGRAVEPVAVELARLRVLEPRLSPLVARVEEGLRRAQRVCRALRGLEEARALEVAHRDEEALEAYHGLLRLHPGLVGALEGRLRIERRVFEAREQDALEAMVEKRWGNAWDILTDLASEKPTSRGVRERLEICRSEAYRFYVDRARAFEARRLPGNALLAYVEASGFAVDDAGEVAREVARLEESLVGWLDPAPELRFTDASGAVDAALRAVNRLLWDVDPASVEEARRRCLDAFRAAVSPGDGVPRARYPVTATDMEFAWYPIEVTVGLTKERTVRKHVLAENSDWEHAQGAMRSVGAELRLLEDELLTTRGVDRFLCADRVELLRISLDQARRGLKIIPRWVPTVAWHEDSRPSRTLRLRAELSVWLRGEGRWLSAHRDDTFRLPEASPREGPVASPLLRPSERKVALLRLADDLGRVLAEGVQGRLCRETRQHYRKGLEYLRSPYPELASESLVSFLLGRHDAASAPLVAAAIDTLRTLTGYRSAGAWLRRRVGGSSDPSPAS